MAGQNTQQLQVKCLLSSQFVKILVHNQLAPSEGTMAEEKQQLLARQAEAVGSEISFLLLHPGCKPSQADQWTTYLSHPSFSITHP